MHRVTRYLDGSIDPPAYVESSIVAVAPAVAWDHESLVAERRRESLKVLVTAALYASFGLAGFLLGWAAR